MIDIQTGKLKYPIVQSPMAGCSDLAFRLVSRKRGMQYCFLEMVSATGMLHDSKRTHELLKTVPEDKPVGAQLVGCDPDIMGEAAQHIEEMGFEHLDLNLGCPVRKVTSSGAGAALLENPQQAEKVFKKVVQSVKNIPVTVKIRKGYEDDSGRQAVEIAKVAEGSGIKAVTMHGRTRAQGYTGKADWPSIGRVKNAVKIPVLGNGDVLSVEDARRMIEVAGVDGIMIGRGGLGNPWLFEEILGVLFKKENFVKPTLKDKLDAALDHMALEVKYEGEQRAIFHMRRIGAWYIAGIPHAARWRGELVRTKTLDDIKSILTTALSMDPEHDNIGEESLISSAGVSPGQPS